MQARILMTWSTPFSAPDWQRGAEAWCSPQESDDEDDEEDEEEAKPAAASKKRKKVPPLPTSLRPCCLAQHTAATL